MANLVNSGNHSALWSKRFSQSPDSFAVDFETSIKTDARMSQDDIKGSIAHARMLGQTGIIPQEQSQKIIAGLHSIAKDLQDGKLKIDYTAEDIHSFIEAVLTDRTGDAGRMLHTGRSRNDQIALDERLYLKRVIPDLQKDLCTFIQTLCSIAKQNTTTLLPGFTHLQHAQPVSLANHLCAWSWALQRDCTRLQDALKRIDLCPLGAGALAGSTLPLDRQAVAKELGFSGVTQNSLDTVADRDFCAEFCFCFSLIMTHLSRFAEEVVLWSTSEFGFIDLSQKWSTGSSIMPQKKNPDFAELIRGRAGRVQGDLVALLSLLKGLPLSYNRDLQEDKASLFSALDITALCLKVFNQMMLTATFCKENMQKACKRGFLNATDLADYLVKKGLPFRTAHGVAATAVNLAIQKHCNIEELSLQELKTCSSLIQDDVFKAIDIFTCMTKRHTIGAAAPDLVEKQIQDLQDFIKDYM